MVPAAGSSLCAGNPCPQGSYGPDGEYVIAVIHIHTHARAVMRDVFANTGWTTEHKNESRFD